MARSTAKYPWQSKKWGAAPAIGSDQERRLFHKYLQLKETDREKNKLKEFYSKAMSKEEFACCVRGELAPDGKPYPWQVEFHNKGNEFNQRAILAANQSGKTLSCAAELSMHAMGWYPNWWEGKRFDRPVKICIGSQTNDTLRDPQQLALFGGFEPESRDPAGTGWIARSAITQVSFRQCGLSGVYDEVSIKHSSGGISTIKSKTYAQGSVMWQGTQYDIYWLDEEPENDDMLFSEVLRGMLSRNGMLLFSRTPLSGMTKIVRHFMEDNVKSTWYKNVTFDDCPHLTDQQKASFLEGVPDHERETRSKGIPMLGEGAIYPIADEAISCELFATPKYHKQLVGIDFGHTGHPTAAVWGSYDGDTDIIYVTDCYKKSGTQLTVANHAHAITSRGQWIPVAWPHDGLQKDRGGSGVNLKDIYRGCHVNMLHISARMDDDKGGGQPRGPIIQECYERMVSGRLLVFKHLTQWFEEKRMYHMKDGKVVDVNDDLISAMHYMVMMIRRYGKPAYRRPQQKMAVMSNPLNEFRYA